MVIKTDARIQIISEGERFHIQLTKQLIAFYTSRCCSKNGQVIRLGTQDVEQDSDYARQGANFDLVAQGGSITTLALDM